MEYYQAYEKRYQAAYEADIELWGNSEKDAVLAETLKKWVEDNNLKGKRVIEFACGEGSCGILLSELGVLYCGVDIAPTAIQKAEERLSRFPDARVGLLDMVKAAPKEKFDAALDVMGLHMIVTDGDRRRYLENAYACLNDHAPMLFFRENYSEGAKEDTVESFADFQKMTGNDYQTPQKRMMNGKEVLIPLLPARARSKGGYVTELYAAGFTVEAFEQSKENGAMLCSADIYVRKG